MRMKLSEFFDRLTNSADNNAPLTLTAEEAVSIRDILDQLTDDYEKVAAGTYHPCQVCQNYNGGCDDKGCAGAYGCIYWESRSFGEG